MGGKGKNRTPPSYHVWDNMCIWVLLFLFVAVVTLLIFLPRYPYGYPPPPPLNIMSFARRRTRTPNSNSTQKTCISSYEEWDPQLSMCKPRIRSPLAFDANLMNHSTMACQSFYGAMCGKWVSEHTNANRCFTYGYQRNGRVVADIIQSTPSLRDFYTSCINRRDETESIIEVNHLIDWINLRTLGDLPVAFARLAKLGYTSPFTLIIDRHPREPRRIPLLAYDEGFDHLNATDISIFYTQSRIFTHLNALQITRHAERVQNVIAILKNHCTRRLSGISDFDEYLRTRFQQDLVAGGVEWKDWQLYLSTLDGNGLGFPGAPRQEWWVVDKPYFDWLFNDKTITLPEWKAYIEFSVLYNSRQFVPELPSDVYYRKHNRGAFDHIYHRLRLQRPRSGQDQEELCTQVTQAMLPGIVAREFIKKEFPAASTVKTDILDMIVRIKSSLKNRIPGDQLLREKIDAIIPRVLEPNHVWQVEPFEDRISPHRYDHNMNMVRKYRTQQNLGLWHKDKPHELDRNGLAFFAMPTTEINAYYSPQTNTITILGGLLQPPFYLTNYGQLSKHAILGSIIGHELGHSIDNSGIMWDARGGYNALVADKGEVERRTACLRRDLDGVVLPSCGGDTFSYSTQVIGEALSDLIGVRSAYDAYFLYYNTSATMGDKQHFFMIYAQLWCQNYDVEHMCEAILYDEHPLANIRVDNTLKNMREFHQAFGCGRGNAMHKEAVCDAGFTVRRSI